jgi:cold shock CspA family protein
MDRLELRLRDVPDHAYVERLVREQLQKLERHCHHITSCLVAVERPNAHPRAGAHYRVRVEVRLAGLPPLVVRRDQGDGRIYDTLATVVHDAFATVDRRVKELVRRQRGEVKLHPEQVIQGVIVNLSADHGMLLAADGRRVYFHANSVVDLPFRDLSPGMGVAFTEQAGDEGPQASTVRVVDARHRAVPASPS